MRETWKKLEDIYEVWPSLVERCKMFSSEGLVIANSLSYDEEELNTFLILGVTIHNFYLPGQYKQLPFLNTSP